MGGDALRPDIEGYGTVAELHIAGGFLASQWVKDHDAAGGEIFWKPWTSEACDPRPVDPGKNFGFQVLYRIAITRSHGVACYACWLVRWVGRKLAPTATRRSLVTSRFDFISRRLCLVRCRTTVINCVRGQVKAAGGRMPTCAVGSKANRAILNSQLDRLR